MDDRQIFVMVARAPALLEAKANTTRENFVAERTVSRRRCNRRRPRSLLAML
jgi:hypothetical protein